MQLLLFVLIFFLAIIFIIFAMFRKVLSFLFGGLRGKNRQYYTNNGQDEGSNSSSNTEGNSSKVFAKNEGEYVNYEEVE